MTASAAACFAAAAVLAAIGPLPQGLRGTSARAAMSLALAAAVAAWFLWTPAPADADWQPDVAQLATFEIEGDQVTVSGIRDFQYRDEGAVAQPRWRDRTFDLGRLRTIDLFFSFWGPKLICHNFVSFGFEREDGGMDHVAVSIEARKRRGQDYSAVGGLFRQFTLAYVWAEERDVVRLRTDFRGERVRRYRVPATQANARILFERYVAESMELAERPRWYNAVTQNCGVDILRTAWGQRMPLLPSPALLLNGTWEEQAWLEGRIRPEGSLDDVLRAADVTDDAKGAPDDAFGQSIRRREVEMLMAPPGRAAAGPPRA